MVMFLSFVAAFFLVRAILKYSDKHPEESYSDDDYSACSDD